MMGGKIKIGLILLWGQKSFHDRLLELKGYIILLFKCGIDQASRIAGSELSRGNRPSLKSNPDVKATLIGILMELRE